MTTTQSEQARGYLRRLTELTRDLPREVRDDLLAGIEEHLNEAEARGEVSAAVVRLGSPDEVAASAMAEAGREMPARGDGEWLVWLSAIVLAGTVAGFACLGALAAFTAHFDDDADWNLSPALVFFAAVAGLLAGIFGTVVTWVSRWWAARDKVLLPILWLAALILAVAAVEIGGLLPVELSWLISGLLLLLGALGVVVVIDRAVRTIRKGRRLS